MNKCWCGSGLDYEVCHREFDKKINYYKKRGVMTPPRSMIKNQQQIEGIKKAAVVNNGLLDHIEKNIKIGMSTEDIDVLTREYLKEHNAHSADLNYEGYPKSICTSINDIVCHGIPSSDVILKDGDIINVEAMYEGMKAIKPWKSHIGDIGKAIQRYAHINGYSVVEEFCGHGIGMTMHEDPYVFHFKTKEDTVLIVPGMVFTIEPMLNQGTRHVHLNYNDDWTVYTDDGKLSAQWEHTFLVTEDGVEIISK